MFPVPTLMSALSVRVTTQHLTTVLFRKEKFEEFGQLFLCEILTEDFAYSRLDMS